MYLLDNPDSFALVALKTIPAGTVVSASCNNKTVHFTEVLQKYSFESSCGSVGCNIVVHCMQIHVTDNGWTANGFRGGEGVLTFTLFEDTSLPAGEVWGYEAGDMTSYTTTYGKWTPVC